MRHVAAVEGLEEEAELEVVEAAAEVGEEEEVLRHQHPQQTPTNQRHRVGWTTMIGKLYLVVFVTTLGMVHINAPNK